MFLSRFHGGRVGFPYAAQCGGYFICISLHIGPVVPFFPPSPPSLLLFLHPSSSLPRRGPSSLPSPLIFPTLSSFSCSPLFLRLSLPPSTSARSEAPSASRHARARACIYFILLLNKPLPVTHPRVNMRLYTYTVDSRQTQSLPLDAGSAYATTM